MTIAASRCKALRMAAVGMRAQRVVSHRPAVILRADWIVYLEAGQVKVQNHPAQLRKNRHVSPFLMAS